MKKAPSALVFLLIGGIGGLIAGLLLPTEQREIVSQELASVMRGMVGRMPDG